MCVLRHEITEKFIFISYRTFLVLCIIQYLFIVQLNNSFHPHELETYLIIDDFIKKDKFLFGCILSHTIDIP